MTKDKRAQEWLLAFDYSHCNHIYTNINESINQKPISKDPNEQMLNHYFDLIIETSDPLSTQLWILTDDQLQMHEHRINFFSHLSKTMVKYMTINIDTTVNTKLCHEEFTKESKIHKQLRHGFEQRFGYGLLMHDSNIEESEQSVVKANKGRRASIFMKRDQEDQKLLEGYIQEIEMQFDTSIRVKEEVKLGLIKKYLTTKIND